MAVVTRPDRPKSVRNRCVFEVLHCQLVAEGSVRKGTFVIGLSQISFFFSLVYLMIILSDRGYFFMCTFLLNMLKSSNSLKPISNMRISNVLDSIYIRCYQLHSHLDHDRQTANVKPKILKLSIFPQNNTIIIRQRSQKGGCYSILDDWSCCCISSY